MKGQKDGSTMLFTMFMIRFWESTDLRINNVNKQRY